MELLFGWFVLLLGSFGEKNLSRRTRGYALTRPWVTCLVTTNDINYLQLSNNLQQGEIIIEREDYAQLMGSAKRMDKKDIYRRKLDMV